MVMHPRTTRAAKLQPKFAPTVVPDRRGSMLVPTPGGAGRPSTLATPIGAGCGC